VWRAEARVDEDTALGDGLEGTWTLVGEPKTHKHLEITETFLTRVTSNIYSWFIFFKWVN